MEITYWDKFSSFNELLEKDNSVSIRHKNMQALATKMYKVSNNMSPTILNDFFVSRVTQLGLKCKN